MKRLHSDPPEQHNEWGATSASKAGEARGLLASFLWLSQKSSPEPGGNASLSLSHTLICHYRGTAVQPGESERPGWQRGSQLECVRQGMDGWLVCMYKMCKR